MIPAAERPRVYVCGSTGFVEPVADWLVEPRARPAIDPHRAIRRHVMQHVDGNAMAGTLAEFFSFDVTTATARCNGAATWPSSRAPWST